MSGVSEHQRLGEIVGCSRGASRTRAVVFAGKFQSLQVGVELVVPWSSWIQMTLAFSQDHRITSALSHKVLNRSEGTLIMLLRLLLLMNPITMSFLSIHIYGR